MMFSEQSVSEKRKDEKTIQRAQSNQQSPWGHVSLTQYMKCHIWYEKWNFLSSWVIYIKQIAKRHFGYTPIATIIRKIFERNVFMSNNTLQEKFKFRFPKDFCQY